MAFTEAELAVMREKRDIKKKEEAAGGGAKGAKGAGGGSSTDYTILDHKTEGGLILEVKKYLSWGWEPIGGVSAAAFGMSPIGGNRFVQAWLNGAENRAVNFFVGSLVQLPQHAHHLGRTLRVQFPITVPMLFERPLPHTFWPL